MPSASLQLIEDQASSQGAVALKPLRMWTCSRMDSCPARAWRSITPVAALAPLHAAAGVWHAVDAKSRAADVALSTSRVK